MAKIEVSQGALPFRYIVGSMSEQSGLIADIYDGMELHLFRSVALLQLLLGAKGGNAEYISGIHQSPREGWPDSGFAIALTLAMLHRTRSIGILNKVARNLPMQVPVTVYHDLPKDQMTQIKNPKFLQVKWEVMQAHKIRHPEQWDDVVNNLGLVGLIYDTQHSPKALPIEDVKRVQKINRLHVSVGRTDVEDDDTPMPIEPLISGEKDEVLYPLIAELARLGDGHWTMVVETKPRNEDDAHWRIRNAMIARNLRDWVR